MQALGGLGEEHRCRGEDAAERPRSDPGIEVN